MDIDEFNDRILNQISEKAWKTRLTAYEELFTVFTRASDENDSSFQPWIQDPGLWKRGLCDSNVSTQECALKVLCVFLDKSQRKGISSSKLIVIPSLLEKCLPSTRPSIRDFTHQALLLLAGAGAMDAVIDGLLSSCKVKHPKQAMASIKELCLFIEKYGIPTIPPSHLYKLLPGLFAQSDKNVRQEASKLAVQVYRWVGDSLKVNLFPQLKPIQISDLESLFQSAPPLIIKPPASASNRSSISAAAKSPVLNENGSLDQKASAHLPIPNPKLGSASGNSRAMKPSLAIPHPSRSSVSPIKPSSFDAPIDILSKLTPEFYSALSSPKWKDRKEALDNLHEVCKYPCYQEGDYDELFRVIAKSLRDANVVVVGTAGQLLIAVSNALKKKEVPYVPVVFLPLFERFKERKPSLVNVLFGAANAMFEACGFNELADQALEFLGHKNPQVKTETLHWFTHCLQRMDSCPPKVSLEMLCNRCLILVNDTFEPVRTATTEVLATLMQMFGQAILSKYIVGLDPKRLQKVIELSENIQVQAHPNQPPRPKLPRVASPLKPSPVKPILSPNFTSSPLAPVQANVPEESPSRRSSPVKSLSSSLRSQAMNHRISNSALKPVPNPALIGAMKQTNEVLTPTVTKKVESNRLSTKTQPSLLMKSTIKEHVSPTSKQASVSTSNLVTITLSEKIELDLLREEKAIRQVQQTEDALERERLFREINDLQIANAELREQLDNYQGIISQKDSKLVSLQEEVNRLSNRLQEVLLELEHRQETVDENSMDIDSKEVENAIKREDEPSYPYTRKSHFGNSEEPSRSIRRSTLLPVRQSLAGSMLQKPTAYSRPSLFSTSNDHSNSFSSHSPSKSMSSWSEGTDISTHLLEQIQRMKRS
ncbi:TOG/XMAP215 microtubule plus end tracking polymerase Dis1 [Schizosaccharomyces osmophilus]|uniref:TOG/XMAP215 microtubule plus end tracking polymerase Dis1 n=1 Tax=Schizosaccharomyces osmophilus TaxID=2545709 RepID=A0AAF0AYM7_9SCHI|nr:TOG/XMAP215 microtubule plus end tracking polymerase Dis1 [Schizosaccharomyces osmophilus]WBW74763.1 TOG/XMAP215 microtubule plus end tracking polymerase Dis1 [Schizosaccharomyces osmophilus]